MPTASGGGVRHSTDSMFAYQRVALSGSHANAATSARGRSITISVTTSTAISVSASILLQLAPTCNPSAAGSLDRRSEPQNAASFQRPFSSSPPSAPPSAAEPDRAEAPAALPPSGTAYRKLNDGDRLAVAAGCRDRAAAKADGAAASEIARVDPRELRDELDAAFALIRNQPRPVAPMCEKHLPFVTPGLTLRFDGAKDGGVEFTYETDSDKPLTIRGAVSPPAPGR